MTRKPTIIAFNNFIFKKEDPSPNADLRRLAVLELNGQKINDTNPIVAINFQSNYTYRLHSYLEKQSIINTNEKPIIDSSLLPIQRNFNLLAQLRVITTNTQKTGEASDDFNIILTNYPNFNWLNESTGLYNMPVTPQYTATTRPDFRLVSNTQPLFLSTLLNFNEDINTLKVQVIATFQDDSEFIFTPIELNNQFPAGSLENNPHIITLSTTIAQINTLIDTNLYPSEIKSITLTILADGADFTNQPISTPQTYHIDYAYYPDEQIIIYKNQIGVYDTLRTTGQVLKELDRTTESFTNQNNEKELKIKARNKLSINLGIENADQSQEICEAIANSKNIYLFQDQKLIPLILSTTNLKPYDSNKQADDQTLEFKYAQTN